MEEGCGSALLFADDVHYPLITFLTGPTDGIQLLRLSHPLCTQADAPQSANGSARSAGRDSECIIEDGDSFSSIPGPWWLLRAAIPAIFFSKLIAVGKKWW